MSRKIELPKLGEPFGKCIYLGTPISSTKGRTAIFRCACGNEFRALIYTIKQENTTSCGCGINRHSAIRKEIIHKYKSEYVAWCSIKYRCYNPSCKDYKHYGGRGIKMAPQWLNSFDTFLADMGPKPTPKHTVERVKVNEDYGPENCTWLINIQQSWNRRNSILLTHRGQTKPLSVWAYELGIPYQQIKSRVDQGFSHERALSPLKFDNKGRPIPMRPILVFNLKT